VPSTNKKRTLSIEARRWRIGGLEEELIFEMEEGIWWAVAEFRLFVACGMESGLRQWLRSAEACRHPAAMGANGDLWKRSRPRSSPSRDVNQWPQAPGQQRALGWHGSKLLGGAAATGQRSSTQEETSCSWATLDRYIF